MKHQLKVQYIRQLSGDEAKHYAALGLLALPEGREADYLFREQPFDQPRTIKGERNGVEEAG
jgi:hypothetical protein